MRRGGGGLADRNRRRFYDWLSLSLPAGWAREAVRHGLQAPTVRLLSHALGVERIGIMVAWITVIHQIGGASIAYLAGVLRIGFGTYFEAFMLAGLLCIAAAIHKR